MKISELNTKSFLGASGAAENSYVLINYEDETTNEPVTYKATVQELGKTIANKLGLAVAGSTELHIVSNNNGTWVTQSAGGVLSADDKAKLQAAVSAGALTNAINNADFASTGYVDNAISNLASTGDLVGLASQNDLVGLASTGYVDVMMSGVASTGFVNYQIANLPGIDPSAPVELIDEHQLSGVQETYPLFIGDGSVRTFYEGSESGQATPIATIGGDKVVVYNSGTEAIGYYDPGDSYFNEITIGGAGVSAGYVANAIDGLASQGYVTSHAGPSMGDIAAEVYNSLTTLHGYVADIASTKAALAVNGLASTGAVTAAVNGLASTGYVDSARPNLQYGYTDNAYAHKTAKVVLRDSSGNFYRINDSGWIVDASTLASQGYVTSAVSGLASTGYVTAHAGPSLGNIAAAVNNSGTILNGYIKAIASTKAATAVNGAVSGLASTGYVTSAVNAVNPRLGYTDTVANTNAEFVTRDGSGNFYYINTSGRLSDIGVLASQGYVTSHIGPSMGAIEAEVEDSNTTLYENICTVADGIVTEAIDYYKRVAGTVAVPRDKLKYNSSTDISSYVTADMISGAASTGYVTNAISGLASTGYVTSAVNNCITENNLPQIIGNTIDIEDSSSNVHNGFIVLSDNGKLSIVDNTQGGYYNAIPNIAYLDTSSNKPCIRDYNGTFQGFLSAT